jgi:prephenate dehydrogenase
MDANETTAQRRIIGLIGLGPTGQAVGRALAEVRTNFDLLGHDRDAEQVQRALKAGAIDRGTWKLMEVAERADLIVLSEPTGQLIETLRLIAPQVSAGTLITDTAPQKAPVLAAASELVPPGVSFIGGHPLAAAGAATGGKPFAGATWCLAPLPSASDDAVRTMTGLVEALGAQPFFIDPAEHDALMAGVSGVRELVDAACLMLMDASPSAPDLRRLAVPLYPAPTIAGTAPAERAADILLDAGPLGVWLDQVLAVLGDARAAIASRDAARLAQLLESADAARQHMVAGPDDDELNTAQRDLADVSSVRHLFLGNFGRRNKGR